MNYRVNDHAQLISVDVRVEIYEIKSFWKNIVPGDVTDKVILFARVTEEELWITCREAWAPSQYKDRLIYVWRFPC